jgi:AraC-like DNA-binding protein
MSNDKWRLESATAISAIRLQQESIDSRAKQKMGKSFQFDRTSWVRSAQRGGLSTPALMRVCAFVEENLGAHLTLNALAGAACMSCFHFARMFRVSTGDSPVTYVNQRRIDRAKMLLESGGKTLSEIAAELGFCDHSHFTRVFRKVTTLLPSEYVKRLQLQEVHSLCAVGASDEGTGQRYLGAGVLGMHIASSNESRPSHRNATSLIATR